MFPVALQKEISEYCAAGGNFLVSGANIGTDLFDAPEITKEGMEFAQNVLKYKWRTDNATSEGGLAAFPNPYGFNGKFNFNTKLNEKVYAVENADGLIPADKDAFTIFRYADNNISAGVAYKGAYKTVSLGFPIETLSTPCQIEKLMGEVLDFFEK